MAQKRNFYYIAFLTFAVFSSIVTFLVYIPYYQQIYSQTVEQLEHLAENSTLSLDHLLVKYRDIGNQIASRTRARQALELYNQKTIDLDGFHEIIVPILEDAIMRNAQIVNISRIDALGAVGVSVGTEVFAGVAAIDGKGVRESKVVEVADVDGHLFLVLYAPIIDRKNTKIGADVVTFDINSDLRNLTRVRTNIGERHFAFATKSGLDILSGNPVPTGAQTLNIVNSLKLVDHKLILPVKKTDLRAHALAQASMILIAPAIVTVLFLLAIGYFFRRDSKNSQLAKQAQSQLEEQKLVAIQSAKLASLGEMAGGIAHEINNPLTIIQGNAALLLRLRDKDRLTPQAVSGKLQKILETVDRIQKIVDGMRRISRDDSAENPVESTVHEIIEDALTICQERVRSKGIDLQVNLQSKDAPLYCRKIQISQVLVNLLNNAVHAAESSANQWIIVESLDLGDQLTISVTDSGGPISLEVQAKLFQPFFTTKDVGKGTGLGLSISRSIAEDHGGKLFLDQTSKTTKFTLELPQSKTKRMVA